ncbi:MAG: hypothetical protein EOP88_00195 [Verrucomicrobiaceae bacterium]|nr:MAG: hypothetical protein EOP88_00195 [Verrucomicrobiaceae bacterium]
MKIRCFAALLVLSALPAKAVVVTTATDEDNGTLDAATGTGLSLREAVKYAPASPTITFDPSLSGGIIRLQDKLLILRPLTIDASDLAQRITLSGDRDAPFQDVEVMSVIGSNTVTLDSVVITGASGAAVRSSGGLVTLRNCLLTGNNACPIEISGSTSGMLTLENSTISGNSGGTAGAIYGLGPFTIRNSVITGNGSPSKPTPAIIVNRGTANNFLIENTLISGNTGGGSGGGIHRLAGPLTVRNCTISGNSATKGAGIYSWNGPGSVTIENCTFTGNTAEDEGGGIYSESELTLRNSVLSSNSCEWNGGGLFHRSNKLLTVESTTFSENSAINDGGALYVTDGAVISGSTFVGNSGWNGGGIFGGLGPVAIIRSTFFGNTANESGGAILCLDDCAITASTITGNSALSGGGIYAYYPEFLNLQNSVVTGNATEIDPELFAGYTGGNNITSGNPKLAPLGDYGGPTHTMPPMADSPAIDAGVATDLTSDQRGFPFVGTLDIGAAEYQGRADLARLWNVDPDGDGIPHGVEQATGTDSFEANASPLTGPVMLEEGGGLSLGFPFDPAAEPGTRWVISRSTDLTPGSFQRIYQFDGLAGTAAEGVTSTRTAGDITVTDTDPPAGNAFYRLETVLDPLPEP